MRNNAKVRKEILPLLFIFFTALSIHFYFLIEKNGLFIQRDGDMKCQFVYFQYFLHRLFSEGHFFWSWKYGLGGDVFGQFIYYYSTSLFFWLTMAFKVDNLRDILELKLMISILKSFLAMSFLYILLRYNQRRRLSSLIGVLIYGGSIFFVKYSLKDDFMIDAMVWLPLVILGFDRLVDKNRKWFFVFAVFLIVASNFYFAYISTIYLFIYAGFKYLLTKSVYRFKDFSKYYLKLIYYYIMGLLIASFSFFPAVYTFLNADRYSRGFSIPLFFESNFYKGLIFDMFFWVDYRNKFAFTIPIAALFLLLYGLKIRDRDIKIRILFAGFMFLLYLFPITYSLFNGFNAIQSRWLYLLIFTFGLVVPYIVDWIRDKGYPVNRYLSIIIFLVLFVLVKLKGNLIGTKITDWIILVIAFLTSLLLFIRFSHVKRFLPYGLLALVYLNVFIVDYYYFTNHLGPYYKQAEKNNKVYTSSGFDNIEEKEVINYIQGQDKGFYRIMWNGLKEHNTPMMYYYNGFSTYQSLIPYNLHRLHKEQYNIIQPLDSPSRYINLDNRLYMENVLTNKYYVVKKGDNFIPFGFKKLKTINNFIIYKNQNFLPIGFMYNSCVDKEQFNKLNYGERDQLVLNALVIDNSINKNLERFDLSKLRVQVLHNGLNNVDFKNIKLLGNNLKAGKNASIIIPIMKLKEPGDVLVQINIINKDGLDFKLSVNGKSISKRAADYPYSIPQEEFLFNCYHDKLNKIIINFPPGLYNLRELKVFFNPYKDLEKQVAEKKKNSLYNISYTEESVKGDIAVGQKGMLYMAVPYSKGWNVKVDGKNADLYEVNYAFIGIPLSKGIHKIELNYITPYFKVGVIVSILSVLSLAIINIVSQRKRDIKKANKWNN